MKKGSIREIVGVVLVLMIVLAVWQASGGSPGRIVDGFMGILQGGADILRGLWNSINGG